MHIIKLRGYSKRIFVAQVALFIFGAVAFADDILSYLADNSKLGKKSDPNQLADILEVADDNLLGNTPYAPPAKQDTPLPVSGDIKQILNTPSVKQETDIFSSLPVTNDDLNKIKVVFNDEYSASPSNKISEREQISIDFVNEDVKQVLRYVAELYDLNIVIPTYLEGKVTLRLKNVKWDEMLEAVLSPVKCTYRRDKNIVHVMYISDLAEEPIKTETFLLHFADAKALSEELKSFVNEESGGHIGFNERSNVLIISERPRKLQMLSEIIKGLDRKEKQVMIEAKFIEVNTTDSINLGLSWPTGTKFEIGGIQRQYDRTKEAGKQIVHKLTDGPATFKIQDLSLGANFSETDNFGKVLSNPTVVTMNNVQAELKVVTNIPIPNYTYNSEKAQMEISGFTEKQAGISLKVTPKVQDEYITLKLEPKLSSKDDTASFEAGTNTKVSYPVIAEKSTISTVTVKSGYTIAIGGLLSKNAKNNISKMPVFGSIPILGGLFSSKDKSDVVNNLIVFLTATEIGFDGSRVHDTPFEGVKNANEKQMHEMSIIPEDLPGYRPTEAQKAAYLDTERLRSRLYEVSEQNKANKAKVKELRKLNKITGDIDKDKESQNVKKRRRGGLPKKLTV